MSRGPPLPTRESLCRQGGRAFEEKGVPGGGPPYTGPSLSSKGKLRRKEEGGSQREMARISMKNRNLAEGLPAGLIFLPGIAGAPQNEKVGSSAGAAPSAVQHQAGAPPRKAGTQQPPVQGGKKTPPPCATSNPSFLLMMLAMVAFFYFFMIRPQQKQEKQRKAMLASLKKNDKVVTTSGIYGTVAALDERTVTLKIDEKGDVRVKFDRSAISGILNRPGGNEDQKK